MYCSRPIVHVLGGRSDLAPLLTTQADAGPGSKATLTAPVPRSDCGQWHCELTVRLRRWGETSTSSSSAEGGGGGGPVVMRQLVVDGDSTIYDLSQVVAAAFGLYDAEFDHTHTEGAKAPCRVNDVVAEDPDGKLLGAPDRCAAIAALRRRRRYRRQRHPLAAEAHHHCCSSLLLIAAARLRWRHRRRRWWRVRLQLARFEISAVPGMKVTKGSPWVRANVLKKIKVGGTVLDS